MNTPADYLLSLLRQALGTSSAGAVDLPTLKKADWEEVNGKRGTAAVRLLNILCGADGCTVEFEYRLY